MDPVVRHAPTMDCFVAKAPRNDEGWFVHHTACAPSSHAGLLLPVIFVPAFAGLRARGKGEGLAQNPLSTFSSPRA